MDMELTSLHAQTTSEQKKETKVWRPEAKEKILKKGTGQSPAGNGLATGEPRKGPGVGPG